MNMRRRSKISKIETELFPFLSVLACTIGTLILLIIVVSTETLSDNPEGLQTGQWGVDVVETSSAADFLLQIGWEKVIASKKENEVFKIEKI